MTVVWRSLRLLTLALILGLVLLLATAAPAWASIHTYHEQPGQTTFRSRQSLRDQQDLAWQATVFKRYTGDHLQGIYLRLVGFPGQVVVNRQGSLVIETGTTAQWDAPYAIDPQTQTPLPDNVTQYDVRSVLEQLKQPIPLTLSSPLAGRTSAQLVVAPYIVAEWLQLYRLSPPSP